MAQPSTQESTSKSDNNTTTNELYPNLDQIKQKKRYRNSISTESPIVMLTPPNPDEVVREERRLSNASAHSVPTSTTSSQNSSDTPKNPNSNDNTNPSQNHLVPPAEPEPEEIVAKLILQRRPSTITTLSTIIKQIFIEKKIKEDGIPSLIIAGLYLGSIGAAKNLEWLKHHGITHVLCVAGGIGECYPKQFIYKVVDIDDAATEDITAHFKACFEFVELCLNNNGKCLVHCFAGMSRSVTVVSAYLMRKRRMYAVPALKFVKQKRSIANPNAGFIVQLIKYQSVLGLKRKHSLDLPMSNSDNESSNDDREEEKADKPKKKSFKSKNNEESGGIKKIKLSPMVQEWETGRRPSLFTALAKLRGIKNRVRAGSTDSAHSNVSAMSENVKVQSDNDIDDNKDNENEDDELQLPAIDANTMLTPIAQAKLQLLKEVSNETDTSDCLSLSPDKSNKNVKFQHIQVLDTNKEEDDDVVTPLETCGHESFPDIEKGNEKPVDI